MKTNGNFMAELYAKLVKIRMPKVVRPVALDTMIDIVNKSQI